jgi:hypothetical protein
VKSGGEGLLGRIGIHRNQTLLQGKEYQVGITLQVEGFHDVMFLEIDPWTVFSLKVQGPAISLI